MKIIRSQDPRPLFRCAVCNAPQAGLLSLPDENGEPEFSFFVCSEHARQLFVAAQRAEQEGREP